MFEHSASLLGQHTAPSRRSTPGCGRLEAQPSCDSQASVREVKRLDSISRSPVYSSLGEALAGLPTIRAYRAEDRLAKRNAALVDASVVMSLVNMSMNRRAGVRRIRVYRYKGVAAVLCPHALLHRLIAVETSDLWSCGSSTWP